jgi:hypothetical protein
VNDLKIIACWLLCAVGAFVGSFVAMFCAFGVGGPEAILGMVPGGVLGAFAGMRLAKESLKVKAHWAFLFGPAIFIGLLIGVGCLFWVLAEIAAGFKIRAPADG